MRATVIVESHALLHSRFANHTAWREVDMCHQFGHSCPAPILAEDGIRVHDGMGQVPMICVEHPIGTHKMRNPYHVQAA